VKDARAISTLKQITYNIQKTNADALWREVSDKKKNRNNSEMSMPRKQPKMNRYKPNKLMPTINFFETLEKEFDDANTYVRVGKNN
jgi:hypothetical protein